MAETDAAVPKFVDVILDVFRIGSNDGAVVMVVRIRELFPLVRNARIEDLLDALTDEPGHMTVSQLGGIALGLTGDGLDAQLVHFVGGGRCEDDPVFQLREEGEPERVVLVHVQNSRNTDLSALCLVCLQRCVTEEEFILIFKKVRDLFFILFLAQTALTAVSTDELTAAGEAVDGQTAVVGAAFTFCHRGGELKLVDLLDGEHRGFGTFHIALSCDEGGSEGSHDTGDIRTDGLAVGDLLKTSENCVVVEGSSLDNDVAAELCGVGNLDYLI